eukprot:8924262-Pyramimonas_sp.AAC.1
MGAVRRCAMICNAAAISCASRGHAAHARGSRPGDLAGGVVERCCDRVRGSCCGPRIRRALALPTPCQLILESMAFEFAFLQDCRPGSLVPPPQISFGSN